MRLAPLERRRGRTACGLAMTGLRRNGTLPKKVTAWARGLRFPQLFFLTVAVFIVDLLVPDAIPFIDEILLGLGAILLGRLTGRATPEESR